MNFISRPDLMFRPILFVVPQWIDELSVWDEHIPFAMWLIDAQHPQTVVQLGTHNEILYCAFCEAVKEIQLLTKCFAVNTGADGSHSNEFNTAFSPNVFDDLKDYHDKCYGDFSKFTRATFDEGVTNFADESIDLLHISGNQTYDAVKHGFDAWKHKLTARAIVLIYGTNDNNNDFGIGRFWRELSTGYPSFEFLHGHGLGILAVGADQPEAIRWLTSLHRDDSLAVREVFSYLGTSTRLRGEIGLWKKNIAKHLGDAQAAYQDLAAKIVALDTLKKGHQQLKTDYNKLSADLDFQMQRQNSYKVFLELQTQRVESYEASTSWRITYPLRRISQFVSRIARLIRNRRRRGFRKYQQWIAKYDHLSERDISAITEHIARLSDRPLISIVVPVYNTSEVYLREMIESVRAQIYPHWELCIADDASTTPHVSAVLKSYADKDPRIKVTTRGTNGNISAASNSALALASGEYFALVDHDDLIAPHALYMAAVAINEHPNTDILYSDEDKIDAHGRRYDPYFKPDWNRELLYAQNYISHFGIYRTALVRQLGGFRPGFEGSQDHDLALRVIAATKGSIVHIRHVLYHWRLFPGISTFSSTQSEKAAQAARLAIKEHLASLGEQVHVTEGVGGYHRVIRPDPVSWPSVTVIIPTRDRGDVLKTCIDGLLEKTDYPDFDIIVADNASSDQETITYLHQLGQRPGVRVIASPGGFNFSRINNHAAKEASGEILLFLNNDISMIEPSWLKEMIIFARREDVGAVSARLLYPDNTVQHGGVVLGLGGVAGHIHRGASKDDPGYFGRLKLNQDISCVTAACMAMRTNVFNELGGFDEKNLAVTFNDVDLCIRIRQAGYRIIYAPYAELYHWESKSRMNDLASSQFARFRREAEYVMAQWGRELAADPFFNPNLSLQSIVPELAFPPRSRRPWMAKDEHLD